MILFSFCSCFHYENVDFVHLYIAFLTPPSPRVTNTFYNTPWLMVLWQNMTWHICNNVKNNNIKCEWFLSVNSYTSITNARHLSSSSCPHGSVVATSLSVKLFVSVDILPPHPPHPVCEYVNENMPLHCALTHTLITQSIIVLLSFPRLVCSLSLPFYVQHSAAHTIIRLPPVIHTSWKTHRGTHTHTRTR